MAYIDECLRMIYLLSVCRVRCMESHGGRRYRNASPQSPEARFRIYTGQGSWSCGNRLFHQCNPGQGSEILRSDNLRRLM